MNQLLINLGVLVVGGAIVTILFGVHKLLTMRRVAAANERRAVYDQLTLIANTLEQMPRISSRTADSLAVIKDEMTSLGEEALTRLSTITALTESINSLNGTMIVAAPNLGKIADNAFLIARGARDLGDGVTALRAVVFGGKRAEDFPMTINDDERVQHANMEYDITQLMIDHGLSRDQAESRIRDMYAGRRMA